MARYPGAQWRPLDKSTALLTTPDILCLHTMVGTLAGTDRYFRTVGTFSHFGIGGSWGADGSAGLDGVVYQWGDTRYRNASNLNGNDRVIGVETADNAARPIAPWTAKQQTAIVNLMVWANRTHGIPLVLIPDSKQGRKGIGYHRQGCDPYRVADGELWSTAYGKDCPTQTRINQIAPMIARARQIVGGGAPPDSTGDEFDMATLSDVETAVRNVFHLPTSGLAVPGGQVNNGNWAVITVGSTQATYNSLNAIKAAIVAVKADTALTTDDQDVILAELAAAEERITAAVEGSP